MLLISTLAMKTKGKQDNSSKYLLELGILKVDSKIYFSSLQHGYVIARVVTCAYFFLLKMHRFLFFDLGYDLYFMLSLSKWQLKIISIVSKVDKIKTHKKSHNPSFKF